jgi:EAL and modified HD-GYP domain-containing signal transduction protein
MPPLDNIFVARQPIFDRRRNIWGYELFFRQCGDDACALITDEKAADSSIIADGFSVGVKGVGDDKTICVNVSLQALADKAYLALPAKSVLLEVPLAENERRTRQLWTQAKQDGYRIAMGNYRGQEALDSVLGMAEAVKVNFADFESQEVMRIRSRLKKHACTPVAAKVEDWQAFEGAKALGFQYFQGYFFSRPEIVPGRKISSEQASLLRLLKVLADKDADIDKVMEVIASEPPLVYRLLRYINSPAFGLSSEISSLQRAVHLLGFNPLKSWAMVACISDMDCSEKGSELSWIALHRAQFLRLLAENGLVTGWDPETMFLLGLFSNIDAVLASPLEDVLAELPLSGDLKGALLGENEMSGWLRLLEDLETGRRERVQESIQRMAIPAFKASKLFLQATRLATEALQAGECN